jgi:hypothetical protein
MALTEPDGGDLSSGVRRFVPRPEEFGRDTHLPGHTGTVSATPEWFPGLTGSAPS